MSSEPELIHAERDDFILTYDQDGNKIFEEYSAGPTVSREKQQDYAAKINALSGLNPAKLAALLEACDAIVNAFYDENAILEAAAKLPQALSDLRAPAPAGQGVEGE